MSDRKHETGLHAFANAQLEADLQNLNNWPAGKDKALAEAAALMKYVTTLNPKIVAAGKLDTFANHFAKVRDKEVRDPRRWGGSDDGLLGGELVKIVAGTSAGILAEDYNISARAGAIEVAEWLEDTGFKMSPKTVLNWTATGKEGVKRSKGHTEAAKKIRQLLRNRGVKEDDRAHAKEVLKKNLQNHIRRTESVQQARSE